MSVTVEPEIVAGPLATEYVIAPLEFDVAATANAGSPYVWFGTVKVSVGAWPDTVKLPVWIPELKFPEATWFACKTTVPAPLSVTVAPEMVAGPETTEYVMAPNEFEAAEIVNGASPYAWLGTVKEIVGAAAATENVAFWVPKA